MAICAGFVDLILIFGFALFCSCFARSAAMMMNRYFEPILSGIFCISTSESCYYRFGVFCAGANSALGSYDNCFQFADGCLKLPVDDQIIVVLIMPDFFTSYFQPLLDDVLLVELSAFQPFPEHLIGGGHNKNADRVGTLLPDCLRPL